MADFLTHDFFGMDAGANAPTAVKKLSERYPEAYAWGMQGPDILFFRKVLTGSPLHKYGNLMHAEKTAGLFGAMAGDILSRPAPEREWLQAYFYGFICHYSLDSVIHPYVYYFQTEAEKAHPELLPGVAHCQLETDIDLCIWKARDGRPITAYDPKARHRLPKEQAASIGALYHRVLLSLYGVSVPAGEITASIGDMLRYEVLLYGHGKGISALASAAGVIHRPFSGFSCHAKTGVPKGDPMNIGHREWSNLVTGENGCEDVLQLLERAGKKAQALFALYLQGFSDGCVPEFPHTESFDNGNPKPKKKYKIPENREG